MKVAFVTTLYAPNEIGGAERTVRTLAEYLVKRGHEAVVISLSPDGTSSTGELNGVRTHYVPLRNLFWLHDNAVLRFPWSRGLWHLIDAYNPMMRGTISRILAAENPDVVQTGNLQGFSVSTWQAAQRLKIPIVQMLHDYYLACPNSSMFKSGVNCKSQCTMCRLYGIPRRLLSNLPLAVTSLSSRVLERLEQCDLFSEVKLKTIVHGANDIVPTTISPRRNKSPNQPITVGYLGRVERTKGIEVLLDAVQRLATNSITVLVAGTGHDDYVTTLKNKYVAENIKFLGFVAPAELFKQIDLLVVPSLWEEPLGRVIYEAYAYGVPSAVSRLGGMPEIVEDQTTGFIFNPGDDQQLAEILRREIEHGWQGGRYWQACMRKGGEFDMTSLFAQYFNVWESVVRAAPIAMTPPPALDQVQQLSK